MQVDAKWEYQENIKQVLIATYSLLKFREVKSDIDPLFASQNIHCYSEHVRITST